MLMGSRGRGEKKGGRKCQITKTKRFLAERNFFKMWNVMRQAEMKSERI